MREVQKLSCPAVHEGLWRDCGLFLVYEQPFWRVCTLPHTSHVVLHPIASPRMPLTLHLVSPLAGALGPLFPFLRCNRLSPFCNLGLGCLVCGSQVLTHPKCPVLSFRWVDTAHPTILQEHTDSCGLVFAELLCNLSGAVAGTVDLPSCIPRHFCPCSGVLWSLVFSLPHLSLHLD